MRVSPGYRCLAFAGALATTFFFSCVHSDKKATETSEAQDSAATADENPQAEIRQWFSDPVLGEWFHQLQQHDSTLNETGFQLSNNQPIQPPEAGQAIADSDWNVYQPYFIYSPDKTKAVDLFSYGTMPVRQQNGSVTLEQGEADNEVSMVDVASRTKRRLLFSGPGTTYQKAAWIGDSVVVITGMSDANEENKMLPMIWRINFSDNTVQAFNYHSVSDSLPVQ